MRKTVLIIASVLLVTGAVAAHAAPDTDEHNHTDEQDETGPTGFFMPDSSLYGLQVAYDNMKMSVGLANPGKIAEKRANEARAMHEKNNTEAMEKASEKAAEAVEKAGENDSESIEKARNTLSQLVEETPEEANQGLKTALENIEKDLENRSEGPPEEDGSTPPPEIPESDRESEEEPGSAGQDVNDSSASDIPEPEERSSEREDEVDSSLTETIVVENDGLSFEQDRLQFEKGETVEIVFANTGGTHDLVISELDVGTDRITGGERDSFEVTFEESGTYEFICTVANHAERGMTGEIVVE